MGWIVKALRSEALGLSLDAYFEDEAEAQGQFFAWMDDPEVWWVRLFPVVSKHDFMGIFDFTKPTFVMEHKHPGCPLLLAERCKPKEKWPRLVFQPFEGLTQEEPGPQFVVTALRDRVWYSIYQVRPTLAEAQEVFERWRNDRHAELVRLYDLSGVPLCPAYLQALWIKDQQYWLREVRHNWTHTFLSPQFRETEKLMAVGGDELPVLFVGGFNEAVVRC